MQLPLLSHSGRVERHPENRATAGKRAVTLHPPGFRPRMARPRGGCRKAPCCHGLPRLAFAFLVLLPAPCLAHAVPTPSPVWVPWWHALCGARVCSCVAPPEARPARVEAAARRGPQKAALPRLAALWEGRREVGRTGGGSDVWVSSGHSSPPLRRRFLLRCPPVGWPRCARSPGATSSSLHPTLLLCYGTFAVAHHAVGRARCASVRSGG